jgi:hypothetical protein
MKISSPMDEKSAEIIAFFSDGRLGVEHLPVPTIRQSR